MKMLTDDAIDVPPEWEGVAVEFKLGFAAGMNHVRGARPLASPFEAFDDVSARRRLAWYAGRKLALQLRRRT